MFSIYGMAVADEAVKMSGIDLESIDKHKFGVVFGSGIGGLTTIEEQGRRLVEKGINKIAPLFIPMAISNIAIRFGARGTCIDVVTACASSTNCIGEAFRNIKHGYSDYIIAGGSEASICELGIGGFAALKALSTSTDPDRASIPFDKERGGFVMGEGAGAVFMESLESAQARGAKSMPKHVVLIFTQKLLVMVQLVMLTILQAHYLMATVLLRLWKLLWTKLVLKRQK